MLNAMLARRSVRAYTAEPISEEALNSILYAGLSCPSSCNSRPWHPILVTDRETLDKLAESRVGSAQMLKGASAAIVSAVDKNLSTAWIEDASAMLMNMHLEASALGLGSCWIQIRSRQTPEDIDSEVFVREVLGIPENIGIVGILSLGSVAQAPTAHERADLLTERIHRNRF